MEKLEMEMELDGWKWKQRWNEKCLVYQRTQTAHAVLC